MIGTVVGLFVGHHLGSADKRTFRNGLGVAGAPIDGCIWTVGVG
jgi:hypothetical protein